MKLNPSTFSIKWKLSLALMATGLGLILSYVFIANNVFQSDKISYVFEAQSSRLGSLKREIDQRLQQTLLKSKSLLSILDANHKMPSLGSDLFKEDKFLLAMELWDSATAKSLYKIEKVLGRLPAFDPSLESVNAGEVQVLPQKDQSLLLVYTLAQEKGAPLIVRVLMNRHDFLPQTDVAEPLVLVNEGEVLSSVSPSGLDSALLHALAQEFSDESMEQTTLWKYENQGYLVSTARLSIGHLRIIAFTSEREALGALNTLLYRSLLFLLFSIFGLIVVSLLLANGLTSNIQILTLAAAEIGKGHFAQAPAIESKDEMGVLAQAFMKMSEEIIRLLQETKDKARMEAELKTAKLVQDSLFPAEASVRINELEINGLNLSSTECGGDWWFYFSRGDDVYVAIADATGHGTPAALITAAARSVFSRLENENLSLAEMVKAWDFAVSSCSKRRVFMTGILLKINSMTGQGEFISAGHESPYLFNSTGTSYSCEMVEVNVNPVLGEGFTQSDLVTQSFQLEKNSSLVLYTDGLFSVETADGKKLSEKRLGKKIAERLEFYPTAASITGFFIKKFEEHRAGLPLPDDVTLVTIRRQGPSQATHLLSEGGETSISSAVNTF